MLPTELDGAKDTLRQWVLLEIRSAFLDAAQGAVRLLGESSVVQRWDDESVLAEFSVAALAGHLLRSIKTVDLYLNAPAPDGERVTAAQYYLSFDITPDISSPLNRDVRKRGAEMSAAGPVAVAEEARRLVGRLSERLEREESGRGVAVLGGLAMSLDDYLCTRVVELVVHLDDLALSVGKDASVSLDPSTTGWAISTLVDIARLRHGDVAVVRSLSRRERDVVNALRVL